MSTGPSSILRPQDPPGARDNGVGVQSAEHGSADSRELPLRERLHEVARDRAACAREIVQESSRILRDWLLERPEERGRDGADLEAQLAPWVEEQGWRGPCALWLDSLRLAWRVAEEDVEGSAGEALALETMAWIEELGPESDVERRLPSRASLAGWAAADFGRGECVLITSWSESVVLALEAAWKLGRRPEVLIGEGLPGLDGRRMARRLARAGIPVTMVYDTALLSSVPRADRLWLSTEAVGAGAFLARRGTRILLEECSRREVPARVLATSDKLMPGGALRLPAWCDRESWLLWEDAPEGVRLESQCFEPVPLELVEGFLTEIGLEATSALHLRALRVEAAPPCGAESTVLAANTP